MPAERRPDPCLCAALRQAARRVSQHYDTALAATGLSTNQYSILSRLERDGPSGLGQLAAALVMDRSTLGHLLRPLEARDLLRLGPAPDDRRRRAVQLTAAGCALLGAARPLWQAAQASFEEAFGPAEARALRDDLRRICLTEPLPHDRAS